MADYRTEPKFPILVFGEGQHAVLKKAIHLGKNKGIDEVELYFTPSDDMMVYYGIDENEKDTINGCLRRRYPEHFVKPLGGGNLLDPMTNTVLVFCSFKWEHTSLTRHFPDLVILEGLEKENDRLRKENARLWREARDNSVNFLKRLKEDSEYMKIFNSWRGLKKPESPEDQDQQNYQEGDQYAS